MVNSKIYFLSRSNLVLNSQSAAQILAQKRKRWLPKKRQGFEVMYGYDKCASDMSSTVFYNEHSIYLFHCARI